MKAYEIMNGLFSLAPVGKLENTCDTLKAGNPDAEVSRIAVTMFATPDVVREAHDWGAELLIVHEPTYYDHMDRHKDEKIENAKRKLIEDSGLTVYRYHDYPHAALPDIIDKGVMDAMGLDGEVEYVDFQDLVRIKMNTPITSLKIARILEDKLGIRHPRICGARDIPCTKISVMPGTPGGVFEELKSDGCEVLLTGEACEWALGEYARDAAQLGFSKSLIIMGHIGSERDGMKYTADILKKQYPEIEVRYIECGEVYSYTDSL